MINIGSKVKATCFDGDIYVGTLTDISIGIDKDNPTQTGIIIEDDSDTYGNVFIWCNSLKNIELINEEVNAHE